MAARVVSRQERHARLGREPFQLQQAERGVGARPVHEPERQAVAVEGPAQPAQALQEPRLHRAVPGGRHDDRVHAAEGERRERPRRVGGTRTRRAARFAHPERLHRGVDQVMEPEPAGGRVARGAAAVDPGHEGRGALVDVERPSRAALAEREQPAESRVALGGLGKQHQLDVRRLVVRAEGELGARADGERDAMLARGHVRTHDAGHGVPVGDAERRHAQGLGAGNQFLGVAGAFEEREVAGGGELAEWRECSHGGMMYGLC